MSVLRSGMSYRVGTLGVALTVLALAGASPAADATPGPPRTSIAAPPATEPGPAPGDPNVVLLTSLAGQPVDSLAALAFSAGFQGAFTDDYFLTERAAATHGVPGASPPLTSVFRLVRGDAFGDEWQLQVTVMGWWGVGARVPPPADTAGARVRGPGLRVDVAVLSAAAAAVGARPMPVREDLTFEVPLEPRGDFFTHAGRMVALLAIESLHRRSGDLGEDTRLRFDRTTRVAVIAPGPSPPHR